MRVLFVYPDLLPHRRDWPGYFYVGIASLSAVLKAKGHHTALLHISKAIRRQDFLSRVQRESPDLIGFSATSPMFPHVQRFASWLQEARVAVPTICGGIHPTIAPEETIRTAGISMICRGEGEGAIVDLCARLERGESICDIPNLWIKTKTRVYSNLLRPLIKNLDELPFPDRNLFDYKRLFLERSRQGTFLASRGCPYSCSYCCNHLIRKIYGNMAQSVRFRSVDHVIAEIRQARTEFPFIERIVFDDDILFLKKAWASEFAEKYPRTIARPFMCNARANLIDEAAVALLKRAGCDHVKLGIESGNETISEQILNRQQSNAEIKRAFALCKKAGLVTESFNMVGIPTETPAAVLDTIKLNALVTTDKMQVSIFQPFPGTLLAERFQDDDTYHAGPLAPDFFTPSAQLSTMTASQVIMFRDYFKCIVRCYQLALRLPPKISRLIIRILDNVLKSETTSKLLNLVYYPLNYLYRKTLEWQFTPKTMQRDPKRATVSSTLKVSTESRHD